MLFKEKYDLVFSLGEACSCTQILRKCRLQFYSYPFDWLYGSTFLDRAKMLASDMENFIKKEDLEFSHEERNISCNAYHNKLNDITFNHDFKKEFSFDEAYIQVKQKYDRRTSRLLEQIEKSKKVLIVYIQTPTSKKEVSEEVLLKGYDILKERFGNKINLLYLYCKSNLELKNCIKINLNDNVKCIKYDYDAYNKDFPYTVNTKKLSLLFNKIKITNKFLTNKNKSKRFTYKIKLLFKRDLWKKI